MRHFTYTLNNKNTTNIPFSLANWRLSISQKIILVTLVVLFHLLLAWLALFYRWTTPIVIANPKTNPKAIHIEFIQNPKEHPQDNHTVNVHNLTHRLMDKPAIDALAIKPHVNQSNSQSDSQSINQKAQAKAKTTTMADLTNTQNQAKDNLAQNQSSPLPILNTTASTNFVLAPKQLTATDDHIAHDIPLQSHQKQQDEKQHSSNLKTPIHPSAIEHPSATDHLSHLPESALLTSHPIQTKNEQNTTIATNEDAIFVHSDDLAKQKSTKQDWQATVRLVIEKNLNYPK